MRRYVDGFLLAVPKSKVPAYRRLSQRAGRIWRELGALEYRESVADGVEGKLLEPFRRGVRLKRGETVIFSWILFASRQQRDRVNAAVMKDPRIQRMARKPMPFDPKRMGWGGFKILVDM